MPKVASMILNIPEGQTVLFDLSETSKTVGKVIILDYLEPIFLKI